MIDDWDQRSYLVKLGDAFSQLLNTILGGAPDESLSGRSWRRTALQPKNWNTPFWWFIRYMSEVMFWVRDEGNHSRLAFEEDVVRSSLRAKALSSLLIQYWGRGYEILNEDLKWNKKATKMSSPD